MTYFPELGQRGAFFILFLALLFLSRHPSSAQLSLPATAVLHSAADDIFVRDVRAFSLLDPSYHIHLPPPR